MIINSDWNEAIIIDEVRNWVSWVTWERVTLLNIHFTESNKGRSDFENKNTRISLSSMFYWTKIQINRDIFIDALRRNISIDEVTIVIIFNFTCWWATISIQKIPIITVRYRWIHYITISTNIWTNIIDILCFLLAYTLTLWVW